MTRVSANDKSRYGLIRHDEGQLIIRLQEGSTQCRRFHDIEGEVDDLYGFPAISSSFFA